MTQKSHSIGKTHARMFANPPLVTNFYVIDAAWFGNDEKVALDVTGAFGTAISSFLSGNLPWREVDLANLINSDIQLGGIYDSAFDLTVFGSGYNVAQDVHYIYVVSGNVPRFIEFAANSVQVSVDTGTI